MFLEVPLENIDQVGLVMDLVGGEVPRAICGWCRIGRVAAGE
jgi:hypothetical protein